MVDTNSTGESQASAEITTLPTAARERVRQRRGRRPGTRALGSTATTQDVRKVVSLVEYRAKKEPEPMRTTEIMLSFHPEGKIEYSVTNLRDEDAFNALLGCYVVIGDLLQTLKDKMEGEV